MGTGIIGKSTALSFYDLRFSGSAFYGFAALNGAIFAGVSFTGSNDFTVASLFAEAPTIF